jgi:2-oxo-4-hydroxy-4-carboxy-5-ureidoimidazoline decarboxylase
VRFSLQEFNALPADRAQQSLLACCSSGRWVTEVAAGRPYTSLPDLLSRAGQAALALEPADLRKALLGHPRIGAWRPVGTAAPADSAPADRAPADRAPAEGERAEAGWSRQEQAGVDTADQVVMQALADGNRAYEERFGHVYLVCATGRNGAELLALLRERLGNDRAAEWRVVGSELEKINRIRLRKLIEA